MNIRKAIKPFIPPVALRFIARALRIDLRFAGRPSSWSEAANMSVGYSSDVILKRVVDATRAVIAGKAAFERDSVLFEKHEYRFPVVSALLRAAATNGGILEVVDFGGSLGSTYRQCYPLLRGLSSIDWRIVEQPHFAVAGQREFTTQELHFVESVSDISIKSPGAITLACGVLQYLETPHAVLQELNSLGTRYLTIDRLPLSDAENDRLCIQFTPKHIYGGSYPCWILSRHRLLSFLSKNWHLHCEFPCEEGIMSTNDGLRFEFKGMILERKL